MRSYEERMAEARKRALNENDCSLSIEGDEAIEAEASNVAASENSSAYDVASETSSELQQPSIDTQKLDRQIKSVMMVGCIIMLNFVFMKLSVLNEGWGYSISTYALKRRKCEPLPPSYAHMCLLLLPV